MRTLRAYPARPRSNTVTRASRQGWTRQAGVPGVVTPEPETAPTALAEWNIAVARELGLESALDDTTSTTTIDALASHVNDGVHAAAIPMTAFLVGVAAGRADDPAVAARDYAEKLSHLADGWDADEERGEPANDQSARG